MLPQIISNWTNDKKGIGISFFQRGKMKHPNSSAETYEFNLGKAKELRCLNSGGTTTCTECEACILTKQLNRVRKWFFRAGDQPRKRFILGLVRRLHSVDLLEYITNILHPLTCKDFMYAKTRTNPSLRTDRGTISSDRALNHMDLEKEIAEAWFWFQNANYWTKSNYIIGVMRECEAHLLSLVAAQAKTLLASERKAFETQDDFETMSIASTEHTFDSVQRPDLGLLVTAKTDYSEMTCPPFSPYPDEDQEGGASPSMRPPISPKGPHTLGISWNSKSGSRLKNSPYNRSTSLGSSKRSSANSPQRQTSKTPSQQYYNTDLEIINDETEDEGFGDDNFSDLSSLDPTCMVIPNSTKAHSGVARYKDFIRRLPVHLSKSILGYLDQVSLNNCVCVSQNWRVLAEEVHRECFVQQSLREEVMLMQGAAAQGCNPFYAKDVDVAVPNLTLDTMEAISTGEDLIQTTYKSEVSFRTAYSGYSTRNIIMEERNVYCGAYNVLVLSNDSDPSRVIHTDAGKWIAVGSQDKKVRFIHSESGKSVGPVISGHAGTVRTVAINQTEGYVLSGSYDTSIRKWSLETGKCVKILRGHTDTINCVVIAGNRVVSGAKDNACKVWLLATGKCIRTFKHKKPVTAVALGEDLCISGCEAGGVKVWNMKTGKLTKKLTGHHEPVTAIRFDKWHIVTGSKDGYALAWSSQGNHKRCLTALRHPSEVLCVEFMYLRVITGSADGKMRIWNMLSGECLRIMTGNSKSDPIVNLIAIDNRVTINTPNNMLVLNFESVEYDYTLEDDKMPPMVQYSKYTDAPIRHQPYAYVRAQRMKRAGATNTKILNSDANKDINEEKGKSETVTVRIMVQKPDQISHSAKGLSKKSMQEARRIHSAPVNSERCKSSIGKNADTTTDSKATGNIALQEQLESGSVGQITSAKSVSMSASKPPSRVGTKSKMTASFKAASVSMISVGAFQPEKTMSDSDASAADVGSRQRRVSWAFEKPLLQNKTKELSLNETKTLLRSQIRAKGEAVPPDFIYLAVNAIQANMKPTEANKNMEHNRRELEITRSKQLGRPTSSPSRIDPKTKIPVDDLHIWDQFRIEHGIEHDLRSETGSKISARTSHSCKSREKISGTTTPAPITQAYFTDFTVTPVVTKTTQSRVPSSIPRGRIIRPHTATVSKTGTSIKEVLGDRPQSAGTILQRPGTTHTYASGMTGGTPVYGATQEPKQHRYSTSATGASHVPMLMYSQEIAEKLQQLPERRKERMSQYVETTTDPTVGRVSAHNNPMRTHAEFKLRTHEQVEKEMINIAKSHAEKKKKKQKEAMVENERRQAWLEGVKSASSNKSSQTAETKVKINPNPTKTVVIVT